MGRKVPDFPAILSQQEFPAPIGAVYTVNVATPLFGGGVEVAKNDPITPIRVSSIRGHLRFWWRATRGARFETSAELGKEEGKIWGTPSDPSRVEVAAAITAKGEQQEDSGSWSRRGRLGYVLFPFQDSPTKCTTDLQFKISLRYPKELAVDVKAAVWAWVNFGGIGARTRRGCGSLFCKEMAPASVAEIPAWLRRSYQAFELGSYEMRPWPTLDRLYVNGQPGTPESAWNLAISLLHTFRQGDIARNSGQGGRPGRSRWPEADSLRALTRQSDARHTVSVTLSDPKSNPAFPRARFGLPIVFHFKDKQDPTLELYADWKEFTRMASPLILRPLVFGDGSKALPMIVRLCAPGPTAVKINHGNLGSFSGKKVLSRPDLAQYPNSPMQGRSKEGSALIAFLHFAKQKGFKEIIY